MHQPLNAKTCQDNLRSCNAFYFAVFILYVAALLILELVVESRGAARGPFLALRRDY